MPRPSQTLIRSFALCLLLVAAAAWWAQLARSVADYRPPLPAALPRAQPGQPLVPQVVLIVVEGLAHHAARDLEALRDPAAARGVALSVAPSSELATWTALVSGVSPELSGAPLLDALPPSAPPAAATLFTLARDSGLVTAFAGHESWMRLAAPEPPTYAAAATEKGLAADRQAVEAALGFLEQRPNLLVVHLGGLDLPGHREGAGSLAYREALGEIDGLLARLTSAVDRRRAVLVVTSNHGHLSGGGHGGLELEARLVPVLFSGRGVRPGQYGLVQQLDLAPTMAAVLGLPLPGKNEGTVLYSLLELPPESHAELALALAGQRIHLARTYLRSVHGRELSFTAEGDRSVAQSSLEVANYGSARTLAGLAARQAEEEMQQARSQRIERERRQRLLPAAVPFLAAALLLRRGRLRLLRYHLFAAALSLGLFHLLYLLQAGSYSLSRFQGQTSLQLWAAAAGLSVLPALVVEAWAVRQAGEVGARRLVRAVYGYALVASFVLLLALTALLQRNGPWLSWYLPELTSELLLALVGFQLLATAAWALILPWPAALVLVLLRWLGRRRRRRIPLGA